MFFSVLVNNGPTEIFKQKRGLRQGDPLSSLLFILGAKILVRKLQFEANCPTGGIGFPLVRGGSKISSLSFADDTKIFDKANQHSCIKVKRIIDQHRVILGQKVNFQKSTFQVTKKVSNQAKKT